MKVSNAAMIGLAGIATGLLVGLLFAPDKGSETRRKIRQSKDNIMDDLKQNLNELTNRFSKKAESIKENMDEVLYKTKSDINEV